MKPGGAVLLLVAVAVVAGCVSGPQVPAADAPDPPVAQTDLLDAIEAALSPDHDHADPALHAGASFGAKEVWRSELADDGARRAPVTEFDVHEGRAYVATVNPRAGMVVLDLADPAAPVQVGRYDAGVAFVSDVKVSSDGRWAFLATEPDAVWAAAIGDAGNLVQGALDPGGPMLAGDVGVQIVDLSDPTRPAFAGLHATADPMGYHMVRLDERADATYVYGAAFGTGRMDILRFETAPEPHLVPVGVYQTDAARDPRNNLFAPGGLDGAAHTVHDMTLVEDPLEGFPLLVVAYWHGGMHLLDASDPEALRFLGRWDAFAEVTPGAVEYAKVTAVEDRRIAVAGSGFKNQDRQGILWVIDATDLAAPQLIGTWSLPGLFPTTTDLTFSTHSFEIVDGKVYLAHYHAGAYVLDISTLDKAAAPEVLAFHIPRGVEPVPMAGLAVTPLIFDAVVDGAHFYLADTTGGLRVVELSPEARPGGVA